MYKRRLLRLVSDMANEPSWRDSQRVNPSDPACVTMQVNMERESLGSIVNITPNFASYLGQPLDSQPIGKNINDMFPIDFKVNHAKMMAEYDRHGILRFLARPVLLVGFDGFLKWMKVTLRILPGLSGSISAVALLDFQGRDGMPSAITDPDMNIIIGERDFWDTFDDYQSDADLVNFDQVCRNVKAALRLSEQCEELLLQLTAVQTPSVAIGGNSRFTDLKKKLSFLCQQLKQGLQSQGIKFTFPKDSIYYGSLHHHSLSIVCERKIIFETEVMKTRLKK